MNDMMQGSSPYGYMGQQQQDTSLSTLRLDTSDIKRRIELYLRGKDVEIMENEKGELVERIVVKGQPKMNDQGIQDFMFALDSFLNQHIVQGNQEVEEQKDGVKDFHYDYSETLMVKLHDYGLNIMDYNFIIDTIVMQFKIYTTRTRDDGERKALVPTMQHIERYTPERGENQGMFGSIRGMFGGGK